MDSSGNQLADGAIDPHYTIVLNPHNGSSDAIAENPPHILLSPNSSGSGWLTPGVNQPASGALIDMALGEYRAVTTIDLTGIDLLGFSLSGFWVSDNFGLDILVNGSATGQTNNGALNQQPDASPLNAFTLTTADGLISGTNDITFVWENVFASGPNPALVRVEFIQFIPEPSSAALLGLGLVGLAMRRRTVQ